MACNFTENLQDSGQGTVVSTVACDPRVADSILRFTSHSDDTINQTPISITKL